MCSKKKRSDCFWGMHSDFHAHPNDGEIIGATLKEDEIRAICEKAKPDFIQIDCKGHPGYATYPTKLGNAMPDFAFDTLALWRKITREYGILLYMHFSGVQDIKYTSEHPDEATMNPDGSLSTSVRMDSRYLDTCFIPQISELVDKYDIDGIWIDGDCWSVYNDYRPEAIARFEKKTGIKLEGTLPTKRGDKYFFEYQEFTRQEYREYLRYYVDKLHEKHPQLEICVNWAFSDHMPEPVCANVDFLSGDLDPLKGVYSSRYAGRMLASQNKPWDLMSWGFRFHVYGTLLTPPKHPVQLMQEAAAVIALGGAFQNNVLQYKDGSPDTNRILANVPLAEFILERSPYCRGGKIIDQAVMFVPSYDRYREMNRPFTREGREKFYGLTALLCDSGESLSIVSEDNLHINIDKYPLVIVPELYCGMSAESIELLREYVLNGGSLMIVGKKTAMLLSAAGFPYKTEEYNDYPYIPAWAVGYGGLKRIEFPSGTPAYFSTDGKDYGVTLDALKITPDSEDSTVIGMLHTTTFSRVGVPFAAVIPYGKGKIGVIGANFGTQYNDNVQYQQRSLVKKMTAMLYDPLVKIESSEGIAEIVCLSVNGELMLQILNSGGSHRDVKVSTENYIPPLTNIRLSVGGKRNVSAVTLYPEGKALPIQKIGDRTEFMIPSVDIHSIAHIQFEEK